MSQGTVFWVTGLSGAGKTTLGRKLCERLKEEGRAAVFLDGDSLREVFGQDVGYSLDDRFKCAMRYSRLCRLISSQGVDVVCATISMFRKCRTWNRSNILSYVEIYIRVPMTALVKRDARKHYSRALKGQLKDVVGVDLAMDEPESPDVLIDNDGSRTPAALFGELWSLLDLRFMRKRK